ncbi:MAG: LuxR C-terminal-related transcriptional regulator [Nocardioides sp.]
MPGAVIETKLLPPRARPLTVPRPRLEELLRNGAGATLTLIAAPAGFGKTTLLGSWLAGRSGEPATAWVSLDERDTDPLVFWSHVLQAVDRALPGAATAALAELGASRAPIEDLLALLLNELGVAAELNLVLDDYHLAESPAIQPQMSFLVDHLPPQTHLVLSTRSDPALSLARLRARGQLVEIRAADLRFDIDEATAYLNDLNTLDLAPADVATLESRTEGWAAALQLAALSLRGKADRAGFIAGFAGDDRFVVDYLADEVLNRQPDEIRAFLLDTSVLDELSASLCDAVTGRTDSNTMLERLDRLNLFLVPLDDQRRKYRYHHLFADVLRARLLAERPQDVSTLHRRASDWHHETGAPEAAVRHAVAAGDLSLAADRIELAIPDLLKRRREAVVRRWARELPPDVVRNRPVLAVGLIGGLMSANDFTDVEPRLDYAESMLAAPPDELVFADAAELARLPATVETYRAALALVGGERRLTIEHANRALARAAADDHTSVAAASALLGLASWSDGDLDEAYRAYRTAADRLERSGHIADVLGCSITLADLEMTRGDLAAARRTFEHGLRLTGGIQVRGVADMYVGLGRVAWEQGDDDASKEYLRKADEAGDANGLPQNPYRWRVMLARLRHAEGDTATAVELLDEAERVYVGDFSPNVQPVAATRARLLAASGDLAPARAWAREHEISTSDDLRYVDEYAHVTLIRVLLAEHAATADTGALADAASLLTRLLTAAEQGHRGATVIESLVLQAVAQRAAGQRDAALSTLAQAVELAEPAGFVRLFLDEGPVILELLRELARRQPRNAFRQRLLRVPEHGPTRPAGQLTEPLSDRELDVLRLLGSELSGPDIARRLHVSLATVRTHTQHIYAKLGVNNRRAAVRRAHQLDVFPRAGR